MSRLLKLLFPARTCGAGASLFLLALRLLFGLPFLSHGVAKLAAFGSLAAAFPDPLGIGSRTSLVLAIFSELFCAAGFVAGAFFRLALLPMIFTMCVAFFVVHGGDPFAARELALLYLGLFVLMFLAGPGDYALDRLIGRALRRR